MSEMTRDEAIKALAAMGAAIAADPRQHCTAHPVFTVIDEDAEWVDEAQYAMRRAGHITLRLTGARQMGYSSLPGEFDDDDDDDEGTT